MSLRREVTREFIGVHRKYNKARSGAYMAYVLLKYELKIFIYIFFNKIKKKGSFRPETLQSIQ